MILSNAVRLGTALFFLAVPGAASGASPGACTLVNAAEMSAILGAAVNATPKDRPSTALCIYQSAGGAGPYAELKVEWGDGRIAMQSSGLMGRKEPGIADPLAGLGDEAYAVGPTFSIRLGEDLMQVVFSGITGHADKARRVVATARPRMPASSAPSAAAPRPATAGGAKDSPDAQALANRVASLFGALSGGEGKDAGGAREALGALLGGPPADRAAGGKPAAAKPGTPVARTAEVVAAPAPGTAPRIPFVVGLTTVKAVTESGKGDYESLLAVQSIAADAYRVTNSGEVPDESGQVGKLNVGRRILAKDARESRVMRNYFHTDDPATIPGTVNGVSRAVHADLQARGRAAFTYLQVRYVFGQATERRMSGELARVEAGPVGVPVIVNGVSVVLPALHAKGRVSDARGDGEMDLHVLDDPENPLVLRSRGPGFASEVLRIDYPLPRGSASGIERKLAENRTAEVYGIYFSFASATIRPESEPVLREIADVMGRHPDWKLRIDGHTDNVGGDPSNLDLSRRRAAAVKAALVERFRLAAGRLATSGFGAGSPKDTNETVQGRARNRRVELTRQ